MESYLLPYDDQLSFTHLVAQIEVVHSLMQYGAPGLTKNDYGQQEVLQKEVSRW